METVNDTTIHIGYHKTGSTFLQKKIFPALPINQVLIPNVKYLAETVTYNPQHFLTTLGNQYDLHTHPQTIISQETLSGRGDGNPMWDKFLIAQRLHQTFPDARILIVIRNQFDYIMSLYTFRVVIRGLERQSLSDYLTEKFDRLSEKLQYHKLVACYQALFTKKRVLVLPYEQLVTGHQQFVQHILDFMQIDTTVQYNTQKVNKGTRNLRILQANRLINYPISATTDRLRQRKILSHRGYITFANKYFYLKRQVINPIFQKIWGNHANNLTFDTTWQAPFLPIFQQSNHKLAQLIDVDLPQYGYPW